jgi:DNA-binding NtrC family response regulator
MDTVSQKKDLHKTILLIHSEPSIRESLDIVLSYWGWHVLIAGSPREGLQSAKQHQPDAIIFDLSTEGMNFFAFTKQLRGNPLTEDIPMVLIGYATRWLNILPFKELNILGTLDYPSDLNQLRSQLITILAWEDESSNDFFSYAARDSILLCPLA